MVKIKIHVMCEIHVMTQVQTMTYKVHQNEAPKK
jgi:hypothetical protein